MTGLSTQSIRQQKKELRRAMSDREWSMRSESIRDRFLSLDMYADCRRLFAFAGFGREPDTSEIISEALSAGKKVALPRCSDDETISFYLIGSMADTKPGRFGIPEPVVTLTEEPVYPEEGDLMLIPGLAFDRRGNRIGYGKGYYDRYLGVNQNGQTNVMAAFEFQEEPELSPGGTDIPVDLIVTDTETIRCH